MKKQILGLFAVAILNLSINSGAFFSSALAGELVIDVSGSRGHDGTSGANAYSAGGDGGNATSSTAGSDAGRISIRAVDLGNGQVQISGTHERIFAVGSSGQVVLRAAGGDGGNGGNGGNGAKGYRGTDGRKATEHSRGTDGTNGGNGGNGGNATSGSNGGNGGEVVVTVKEKDMHLLYLFAIPSVGGGAGGTAGRNGTAGAGGEAGRGGESHSWEVPYESTCPSSCPSTCSSTCTEDVPSTCSGTRTESTGNGATITVNYDYPCTKSSSRPCMVDCMKPCDKPCTKYRTESNPGGHDGIDGKSGSDGYASVHGGSGGANGSYRFVVEYSDGRVVQYASPFDVVVTSFKWESEFGDRFVQPGERARIAEITLSNRGGMPSPTLTGLSLRAVMDYRNGLHTKETVVHRGSIAPGASAVVKLPLDVQVDGDILNSLVGERKSEGGAVQGAQVGVSVEVMGINRFSNAYTSTKRLELRFPIQITQLLGRRSIAQGEDYLFRWSAENLSNHAVGGSNQGVRFISSYVFNRKKSDKTSGVVIGLRDPIKDMPGGQAVSEISPYAGQTPGGSLSYSATIGFDEKAKPLEEGTLRLALQLEDPHQKGVWREVDVMTMPIKVGTAFVKSRGTKVLLVTNPQTSEDEIGSWKSLLSEFGLTFDIWDVGVMGPLDLSKKNLGMDYHGGTIIILNDLMKQTGDEAIPADAMYKLSASALENLVSQAKANAIGVLVFDRTGSYKAVAGGHKYGDRTPESAMFVALKRNEQTFKNPAFEAKSFVALAMTFSFKDKLRLLSVERNGTKSAVALEDAVVTDLAIEQSIGSKDAPLTREFIEYANANKFAKAQICTRVGFFNLNGLKDSDRAKAFEKLLGGVCDYKNLEESAMGKDLDRQTKAIESRLVSNDKTRFFTFPRRWRGDYYQQAVEILTLGLASTAAYTTDFSLMKSVMTNERPVAPAFQ